MKRSLGPGTILYPTPLLIVGTYDREGRPNIMAAAWGGICCSKPPCVTISLREATYTFGAIKERGAYTLSVPSLEHAAAADYVGIVSGRKTDKFADTGLTPVGSDLVDAPYVGEFPMVLECKLRHTFELGLHTQFVGEIVDVKVDEGCVDEQGRADPKLVDPLAFAPGIRRYYGLGALVGEAFSIGKQVKPH